MKNKVLAALGFVALLFVAAMAEVISKEFWKSAFSPSSHQIEEKLIEGFRKGAEQANRQGSIMVDEGTRLDRTEVGPGAHVTYLYSLPNDSSRNLDLVWLQANLKQQVKQGVCASKEMKPSLRYGATYAYAYSDKDGVGIVRFELNKNDCP